MGKVVNFHGTCGSGKSTMAAEVFAKLKRDRKYKVELITEFPKEIVYRGDLDTLKYSQPLIFGEQHHRLIRCINTVDLAVCDSPLILSLIYSHNLPSSFYQSCLDIFHTFDNINFFIKCNPDLYQRYGRTQTVDESLEIEKRILNLLNIEQIPYRIVNNADDIVKAIYEKQTK